MTTPDQVKQEILEELKEAHAEMFSGKLSPLYLDNLMSTALDRYGEAVRATSIPETECMRLTLDAIDQHVTEALAKERERVMQKIEDRLPAHEASLHITHNQHKAYYEPIEIYIQTREIGKDDEDWATQTSKQRAIETDSLWELQWYPNTPVGFNVLYGATLEEILQALNH